MIFSSVLNLHVVGFHLDGKRARVVNESKVHDEVAPKLFVLALADQLIRKFNYLSAASQLCSGCFFCEFAPAARHLHQDLRRLCGLSKRTGILISLNLYNNITDFNLLACKCRRNNQNESVSGAITVRAFGCIRTMCGAATLWQTGRATVGYSAC